MPEAENPGQTPSLARSWQIQRRVIFALLMREVITRYGRHNIGFLWLFVEPMIFTIGVTLLWSALRNLHGADLPIAAFALTGYSSVLVWRNMPNRLVGAIHPNLSLMYHRNVKVIDIFAARVLLECIGVGTSFFVLTLFFASIGWLNLPEDPAKVVIGWIMLAWFGISLAMFIGALSNRSELIDKFWHPITYLMFPLSGAGWLVDAAPATLRNFILYVPMVHGVEWVRDGFFGSHFEAHYDPAYLITWNVALMLFALIEIRYASRNLVPE